MAPCAVALKEWSVVCRALEDGRQIVLLRKGGLLDEDGVFSIEHSRFWLLPTYLHQEENLVKAEHRDLFALSQAAQIEGENKKIIALRLFAQVEQVWQLNEDSAEKLSRAPHIWSENYLDVRFDYRPEKPLLCVALRIFVRPEPYLLDFRAEYFGCRSWIELPENLSVLDAHPVLDEAAFAAQVNVWRQRLA
jgi:hypothetical protein